MNLKKKMTRRFKYYCGLKKRLWDLKTIFGLITTFQNYFGTRPVSKIHYRHANSEK